MRTISNNFVSRAKTVFSFAVATMIVLSSGCQGSASKDSESRNSSGNSSLQKIAKNSNNSGSTADLQKAGDQKLKDILGDADGGTSFVPLEKEEPLTAKGILASISKKPDSQSSQFQVKQPTTPASQQQIEFKEDHIDKLIKSQKKELTLAGITKESSPAEVAEGFMRCLANRQQLIAERMLTVEARVMTNRVGLQLSPVASQKAKYVTGKTTYATNRKKVAYVECHVHDPLQGASSDFKITWMLKKTSNNDWKISGMRTVNDGIPSLISFENINHVSAIVQSYQGPGSGAGQTTKPGTLDDKTKTERYAAGVEKKTHR